MTKQAEKNPVIPSDLEPRVEKIKTLVKDLAFRPEEKDFIRWLAKDTAVLDYFAGQPERVPKELWLTLETLRKRRGDDLFVELVYALTHRFFHPEEAKVLWELIVSHKKHLSLNLNREVGIKVAIMDYLDQNTDKLKDLQLFPEEDVDRLFLFANEDSLTGLYNHRYFQERLHYEVLRSRRYGHSFGLLLIDVDNFKHYNDSYGHLKGDVLLREIGKFFKTNCREADVVARYGGDEFAFILPETAGHNARLAAQRLHAAYKIRPFGRELPNLTAPITISIGLGNFPKDGKNAEALIESADRALYRAKRAGRDQICLAGTKKKARTKSPL